MDSLPVPGEPGVPVRAVTAGPGHHSFGYYDKCPWDVSGRYLLALRAPFSDRAPEADDVAVLGVVDLQGGDAFRPFAETRAWNWQQGCMLHWLGAPLAASPPPAGPAGAGDRDPGEAATLVVFNDREGDRFVAVVADALSGRVLRRLPLPVYGLSPDGRQAVTLNFSRLHHQRPGYGYAGVPDPWAGDLEPANDGISWMDLATGAHRLVVPTAALGAMERRPSMDGAVHRFNHLQFAPDGRRFAFLHRWKPPGAPGPGETRLATAVPDGTAVAILADEGRVSHYDWRDPATVLAWARVGGRDGFFLIAGPATGGGAPRATPLGQEAMPRDGHCSFSPDGARRWVLNDTYPDAAQRRTLFLFDTASGRRHDLGRFYSPPELPHECRVDLHPRWSRDERQVCFDSAHEGTRQLYVADVSAVTAAGGPDQPAGAGARAGRRPGAL